MSTRHVFARSVTGVTIAALCATVTPTDAGQKPKAWEPNVDPSRFVSAVTNPYFPLTPGTSLRFADQRTGETLRFDVTFDTRVILGVTTIVVRETAAINGLTIEIADNWFAQDRMGHVWYFGESTQEYVNGVPTSTAGSWMAGVNGAQPGIIMRAHPGSGDTYFQEYAPGIAEDMATVIGVGGTETTPLATYSDVVVTKEWTALESNSLEHKIYAPGIGLIAATKGGERLELVAIY